MIRCITTSVIGRSQFNYIFWLIVITVKFDCWNFDRQKIAAIKKTNHSWTHIMWAVTIFTDKVMGRWLVNAVVKACRALRHLRYFSSLLWLKMACFLSEFRWPVMHLFGMIFITFRDLKIGKSQYLYLNFSQTSLFVCKQHILRVSERILKMYDYETMYTDCDVEVKVILRDIGIENYAPYRITHRRWPLTS